MIPGEALIRPHISRMVQKGLRLFSLGPPPRHQNDYSTHVPILVGLASTFRIAKILEFGAGSYSTLTFLNRSAFPDVVLVESIESDPQWMAKISDAAKGDSRLQMRLMPEPIEDVLQEIPLDSWDLILVDSSTEATRRASLIEALARGRSVTALVVVHDFEIALYRKAAKGFRHRIGYSAYNPCTGVVWQGDSRPKRSLKDLSRIIHRYSKKLQPDDVQSWCAIFHKEIQLHNSIVN